MRRYFLFGCFVRKRETVKHEVAEKPTETSYDERPVQQYDTTILYSMPPPLDFCTCGVVR